MLATYEQLFVDNNDVTGLQLPEDVIDEIHKIVNAHWRELMTGPGKSVYLSTFFLDPRWFHSIFYWPLVVAEPCVSKDTSKVPFSRGEI